jgi:hypothetical protein
MAAKRAFAIVVVAVTGLLLGRAGAQTPAAPAPAAPLVPTPGKLIEFSNEARFQMDVQVPDSGVLPHLPPGWALNVSTQGNAKDCNLRVIFIDRLTINGPDGRPVGKGSNRLVYLAVPVREPGGTNAQLIIGGLTEDPADVPGPFGNYLLATTHEMRRTTTKPASGDGPVIDTQDWNFAAATGERLELRIKYERGVSNKGNLNDTRFYSAKNPGFFQISRQEQVLEVIRNVTTSPRDRVLEFSFKGSGGSYAKIFDGTEKMLSWDNILWINRSVYVP